MSDNQDKNELESLFNKEVEILNECKTTLGIVDSLDKKDVVKEFEVLLNAYDKLLKQQFKLTKLADTSQRKLRTFQVDLDRQNDELSRLNDTKDKFFSIISHDLRNPITAVMLMGDILKSNLENLSSEQLQKQISKISDSLKQLYELFENLHRWSQSQTGTIDFNPEEFNLLLIVNDIIKLLKTHAGNKNIKLEFEVEPDIVVFGDKNMIETAIRNLVSNAIKFTNKDGVIQIKHEYDSNNSHQISIIDNGIGMDDHIKERLFKIGEKGIKQKGTAQEPGSGLGLILCQEFVEKHGGKIWVESQVGVGSTFNFTIPLSK